MRLWTFGFETESVDASEEAAAWHSEEGSSQLVRLSRAYNSWHTMSLGVSGLCSGAVSGALEAAQGPTD